jgi:hypothetical protein
MEFDEKARENLEAVERLRADDDGVRLCLGNAVANRAYFAAYHAVAHVAQRRGIDFTSEKGYYRHDSLPDDAARSGILGDEGRRDLKLPYGTRVKADYDEAPVELEEAEMVAGLANKVVQGLVG